LIADEIRNFKTYEHSLKTTAKVMMRSIFS